MAEFRIEIAPYKIAGALLVIIAGLAFMNVITLVVEYGYGHDFAKGFVPMFRLNAERNIPTFFSASLILSTSIMCFVVSRAQKPVDTVLSRYWRILSFIALFLAFDEAAHIHEIADDNKEWTTGLFEPTGVLDGPWVVLYGAFLVVFVAYFLRFYLKLATRFRVIFGAAGGIFVAGAIGFEMIGAAEYSVLGETLKYEIINSIEECMEMIGVTLALFGLTTYLREELGLRDVLIK